MMKDIRLRICTLAVLLLAGLTAMAQQMQVTGTVVDKATGETIIGASVVEAGTQNGVITDFDGKFALSVAPGATISITYIGYKPVTVKAAPTLEIAMEEDSEMLDEVVVTGYDYGQRFAERRGHGPHPWYRFVQFFTRPVVHCGRRAHDTRLELVERK